MKTLAVLTSLLAAVVATPGLTSLALPYAAVPGVLGVPALTSSQYHAQDELGQYSYGYAGGPSAKNEVRTADGITQGGYSYVDANGIIQSVSYVSDPVNGFRVAASNLPQPVAPIVSAPVASAVVVDSPEVVVAKAAHFAAVAEATARVGLRKKRSPQYNYSFSAGGQPSYNPFGSFGAPANAGPVGDTPEVAAAKAAHFQAVAQAQARNNAVAPQQQQHYSAAPQYQPPAQIRQAPNGQVLDTPEVAAAKAAHFQAVAQAQSQARSNPAPQYYSPPAPQYHNPAPQYHHHSAPQYQPVAQIQQGPNGQVLDTPEVAAAKAAHFQAVAQAHARSG